MLILPIIRSSSNSYRFSLANHLVDLDPDVKAPDYVEDHPLLDLSSLVPTEKASNPTKDGPTFEESLSNVDVLSEFPNIPESGMDASQMAALKSMLTKKVAIVQGPPGTGKTFVSVAALRVLLANLQPGDPPIVVSAQTNHALDQLLNHVLAFEPNILRLGGRCGKENEAILKRTMYELRTSAKDQGPQQNHGMKAAYQMLDGCRQKIELALMPLVNQDVISLDTLLGHKIISQAQHDSLEGGSWVGDTPGMGLATCEFLCQCRTFSQVNYYVRTMLHAEAWGSVVVQITFFETTRDSHSGTVA